MQFTCEYAYVRVHLCCEPTSMASRTNHVENHLKVIITFCLLATCILQADCLHADVEVHWSTPAVVCHGLKVTCSVTTVQDMQQEAIDHHVAGNPTAAAFLACCRFQQMDFILWREKYCEI